LDHEFEQLRNFKGFIYVHGVQYGICIVFIDKETADHMISNINRNKCCDKCIITTIDNK